MRLLNNQGPSYHEGRRLSLYTAITIAEYFLSLNDPDAGDVMTNLHLQKLLYYAQGWHGALFHRPLFAEPLEAWMHGPVVPSVYYGYPRTGPLTGDTRFDPQQLDPDTRAFLDEVYAVYGQFSAWKLRNLILTEPPWRETPTGQAISPDHLQQFFQTRVRSAGQGPGDSHAGSDGSPGPIF